MPESLNYDLAKPTEATESADLQLLRGRVAALEAACAEAQHSLQTFVEYSPVGFVILDMETGRFLEANPVAERMFGFPRTTLLEMGPFELSPFDQPDGPSSMRGNEQDCATRWAAVLPYSSGGTAMLMGSGSPVKFAWYESGGAVAT